MCEVFVKSSLKKETPPDGGERRALHELSDIVQCTEPEPKSQPGHKNARLLFVSARRTKKDVKNETCSICSFQRRIFDIDFSLQKM